MSDCSHKNNKEHGGDWYKAKNDNEKEEERFKDPRGRHPRCVTPHHAPLRMLMVFLLFLFYSTYYRFPILRAGPSNSTRTGRPSVSGTEHSSPPDKCARLRYAGIAANRNCFRSSREANTRYHPNAAYPAAPCSSSEIMICCRIFSVSLRLGPIGISLFEIVGAVSL